jgi:hypothetical protein
VLLVLMLLLVLLAAIGLGPERPGSLGPAPTPPHFEAAVSDSVALASPSQAALVGRGVAVPKAQGSSGPNAPAVAAEGENEGGGALAVSTGQAIAVAEPRHPQAPAAQTPAPAPEAQPVSAPVPEPAAAPLVPAAPSSSGAGGGQGGPIRAGVEPEPVCEGDEYTITAVYLGEGEGEEGPRLEIVLRREAADGTSEELRLEGGLADVQSLVVKLSGEGGCVSVQIEASEGGEAAPPVVEAGLEEAPLDEPAEPPLP